ncbi:uncharacterized protein LOC127092441 isoform X2 [Lathyrus oleraceus]|uniref:Mitochondrial substrate carrier family protein ucpB n=1 Tax=Pisum sativum TaxID=3888 RepID=A0A9D4WEF2_PEA|nr:uncharacterized protein LOC127092441 isoform X2 [Pisum sativum]KAI5399250.1 hypothetical protein KIW84_064572 [Pisum sativum]
MVANSSSDNTALSETANNQKQNWASSPSTVFNHFATSGLSVAIATSITHPLDVLKVRLQMQLVGQKGPLSGMGQLFLSVVKNEGPKSLYLGLTPALTRNVCWCFCNWTDQSNGSSQDMGKSGPISELQRTVSEEGIKALWKGVGPAMARAAALTASQLATYDETKQILVKWTSLREGFHLHLISSTVAGILSTLITAPVDMVKTRLMLQRQSKGGIIYKNGFNCAYQVLLTEGPKALYKGGFAIFARLGPQTTITFILCEELRKHAGLEAI